VPIELLDVAGLVPGAHMGKGLGNRFLDDLRHADALVHVVDVSGTTDAEGKATRGYDPSQDIVWLRSEIVRWIQGNLMEKWGSYPAAARGGESDGRRDAAGAVFGLRLDERRRGALSRPPGPAERLD
jgi:ribosome-binding ATPase YchF (GTP1/OBG family)